MPFSQLCAPPAWLSEDAEAQARLGALGVLVGIAPRLAGCIDGRVLGPLADAFGDDALEAALAAPPEPEPMDTAVTPAAIRAAGAGLASAALGGDARAARLMQAASALPQTEAEEGVDAA